MRMWMAPLEQMCRRHLLGEHVELHMIASCMRRKMKLDGFFEKNCIEPLAVKTRHDAIAGEMVRRGYDHKSPLRQPGTAYLKAMARTKVDRRASLRDLRERCAACRSLARGRPEPSNGGE